MADEAKSKTQQSAKLKALQLELQEFRDFLPTAFLEVDIIAPRLIYMNRMAYILFGYTEEDFRQGIALPDLFAANEYERAFRDMIGFAAESIQHKTAYQRTGQQDLFEYQLKRKDSTIFPAETQSSFVLDENQIPVALRTFIRDISQRKTAEAELKQYQQHLEQLIAARTAELNAANERLHQEIAERTQVELALRENETRNRIVSGLAADFNYNVLITPDGAVTPEWGTEAFYRMTGYRLEELSGFNWHKLIHPDDQAMIDAEFAAMSPGLARAFEHRIITKSGATCWIRNHVLSLLDEQTHKLRIYGAAQDITQRKQAAAEREALLAAEHEQRLRAETLTEVTLALTSKIDPKEVLEEILRQAKRIVAYNTASITLLEDETLYLAAEQGYQDFNLDFRTGEIICRLSDLPFDWAAVQANKPVIVSDVRQEARWLTLPQTDWIRSHLMVPICAHNQVLGLLNLNSITPDSYSLDDANRLRPLTNAAAIALENARLYEQARQEIDERRRAESVISEALQEKEVLLKEVHHRVKNNLQVVSSLLSLQADYIQNEQARRLFQESQHRVRSMALIHEQLYQAHDVNQVNLTSYIRTLTTHLFYSYDVNTAMIHLDLQIDEAFISLNRAIPCGLVINELVSNALKYAFPNGRSGQITISLHAGLEDNSLTLRIADDGVGLPTGLDYRQTDSLGLQLVMLLIHQLKGTISLDRNQGTTFTIAIPGAEE